MAALFYNEYEKKHRQILKKNKCNIKQTLQLREEQLDIKKERVQTGEVKVHKEVVEEPKTFTIPIKREEMVIEAGNEEEFELL